MLKSLRNVGRKFLFLFVAMLGLFTSLCQYAAAQTPTVLPDIGADMDGTIDAVGTAIGPIIKACLLMAAAILVARVAWKWIKSGSKA